MWDACGLIDSSTWLVVHQNTSTPDPIGSMYTFKLSRSPFAPKTYENMNNFMISSKLELRNSGVYELDWLRLIGEQLSGAAISWYKLIKSMGLFRGHNSAKNSRSVGIAQFFGRN